MKKTWYEGFVKFEDSTGEKKCYCVLGNDYKRKFNTEEECIVAINNHRKNWDRKDTTITRNGKVYYMSCNDLHGAKYIIKKYVADIEEEVIMDIRPNEELVKIYNDKKSNVELVLNKSEVGI